MGKSALGIIIHVNVSTTFGRYPPTQLVLQAAIRMRLPADRRCAEEALKTVVLHFVPALLWVDCRISKNTFLYISIFCWMLMILCFALLARHVDLPKKTVPPWTPAATRFLDGTEAPKIAMEDPGATKTTYPLIMTNSLPWKDPPFLSSVNHLFRLGPSKSHGYVTNNQRVTTANGFQQYLVPLYYLHGSILRYVSVNATEHGILTLMISLEEIPPQPYQSPNWFKETSTGCNRVYPLNLLLTAIVSCRLL